jgi:hypothetical protein
MNKVTISTKDFIKLVNRITKLEVALIQIAIGDGCNKTAIKTAEELLEITVDSLVIGSTNKESLTVFDASRAAFPPETRITVNGKSFLLKDIDKEMRE